MSDTELWLIRHGESTWNVVGRWQGQGDPPLSARGRAQARALGAELLAGSGIAAVVASDLARAAETARLLARAFELEPCFDARLRERDLGTWTGQTGAAIAARFGAELARLRADDRELRPGGGETLGELRARVAAALAALEPPAGGAPLAVVTHLGVIRLLTGRDAAHAGVERTSLEACRVALRPRGRSAAPSCGSPRPSGAARDASGRRRSTPRE